MLYRLQCAVVESHCAETDLSAHCVHIDQIAYLSYFYLSLANIYHPLCENFAPQVHFKSGHFLNVVCDPPSTSPFQVL